MSNNSGIEAWHKLIVAASPDVERMKTEQGHGEHSGWGIRWNEKERRSETHCGCGEELRVDAKP